MTKLENFFENNPQALKQPSTASTTMCFEHQILLASKHNPYLF
jgi:hypothetical protein